MLGMDDGTNRFRDPANGFGVWEVWHRSQARCQNQLITDDMNSLVRIFAVAEIEFPLPALQAGNAIDLNTP